MGNSNPYKAAQAALVLNHLVLDISQIDNEALTRFCNDPQSEERTKVAELFTAKVQKVSDLLKDISTILLPAVSEFIARDKFLVDTSKTADLKICYLGENFKKWFIGKVEENIGGVEVKTSKLLKRSLDESILDELGDRAENALAHVYEFLFLKTADKKLWYLFYVKDVEGQLRAVGAFWNVGGWYVDALSVGGPGEWFGDGRVVSR